MATDPTVNDLFVYQPGNHGLTDEVIYAQQPFEPGDAVPVYSGSEDNEKATVFIKSGARTNSGDPVVYFSGPCLILTKDGSAGLLAYKGDGERFTLNHHACVLTLRPEWAAKVDLLWFAEQYQSRFLAVATSRSDNRVFSVDWFDRLRFGIPDHPTQARQRKLRERVVGLKSTCRAAAEQIRPLVSRIVTVPPDRVVFTGPLGKLFAVHGGNSGLTKEFIYHNLPLAPGDGVPIRSGATQDENQMGEVRAAALLPNGRSLKIFRDECLLVTRKGYYAGTASYWAGGPFAPNDDINVLLPAAEFRGKVNLLWLAIQFAPLFRSFVSSRSDNATFNQGWLDRATVQVPDKRYQDDAARELAKWHHAYTELRRLGDRAAELLLHSF